MTNQDLVIPTDESVDAAIELAVSTIEIEEGAGELPPEEHPAPRTAVKESVIDEFADSIFEHLGRSLTHELVATYKKFKLLKDKIQPGRLTPEGFAAVIMIAEIGEDGG